MKNNLFKTMIASDIYKNYEGTYASGVYDYKPLIKNKAQAEDIKELKKPNTFLQSVLDPFNYYAKLPARNLIPTHKMQVRFSESLTIGGTGSGIFIFRPSSTNYTLAWYVEDPTNLGEYNFKQWITGDRNPASDHSLYMPGTAGFKIYANTVSSGTYEVSGEVGAENIQELPNPNELALGVLTAFATPLGNALKTTVTDGLIACWHPTGKPDFMVPETSSVFQTPNLTHILFDNQDTAWISNPASWNTGVLIFQTALSSNWKPTNLFGKMKIKTSFDISCPTTFDCRIKCDFYFRTAHPTTDVRVDTIYTRYIDIELLNGTHGTSFHEFFFDVPGELMGIVYGIDVISGVSTVTRYDATSVIIECFDCYKDTVRFNALAISYRSVGTNNKLSIDAIQNLEVVPNAVLAKNKPSKVEVTEDPVDIAVTQLLLAHGEYKLIRSLGMEKKEELKRRETTSKAYSYSRALALPGGNLLLSALPFVKNALQKALPGIGSIIGAQFGKEEFGRKIGKDVEDLSRKVFGAGTFDYSGKGIAYCADKEMPSEKKKLQMIRKSIVGKGKGVALASHVKIDNVSLTDNGDGTWKILYKKTDYVNRYDPENKKVQVNPTPKDQLPRKVQSPKAQAQTIGDLDKIKDYWIEILTGDLFFGLEFDPGSYMVNDYAGTWLLEIIDKPQDVGEEYILGLSFNNKGYPYKLKQMDEQASRIFTIVKVGEPQKLKMKKKEPTGENKGIALAMMPGRVLKPKTEPKIVKKERPKSMQKVGFHSHKVEDAPEIDDNEYTQFYPLLYTNRVDGRKDLYQFLSGERKMVYPDKHIIGVSAFPVVEIEGGTNQRSGNVYYIFVTTKPVAFLVDTEQGTQPYAQDYKDVSFYLTDKKYNFYMSNTFHNKAIIQLANVFSYFKYHGQFRDQTIYFTLYGFKEVDGMSLGLATYFALAGYNLSMAMTGALKWINSEDARSGMTFGPIGGIVMKMEAARRMGLPLLIGIDEREKGELVDIPSTTPSELALLKQFKMNQYVHTLEGAILAWLLVALNTSELFKQPIHKPSETVVVLEYEGNKMVQGTIKRSDLVDLIEPRLEKYKNAGLDENPLFVKYYKEFKVNEKNHEAVPEPFKQWNYIPTFLNKVEMLLQEISKPVRKTTVTSLNHFYETDLKSMYNSTPTLNKKARKSNLKRLMFKSNGQKLTYDEFKEVLKNHEIYKDYEIIEKPGRTATVRRKERKRQTPIPEIKKRLEVEQANLEDFLESEI